jgi:hypothetical protein
MDVFIPLLEPVELLEHGDGHRDVVFLEIVDASGVVKDNVGVENE